MRTEINEYIVADSEICHGKPTFKGTRIMLHTILEMLEGGADFKEILEKETLGSQKIVGEKIEGRYQEVRKEIENYRSTELLRVREDIYKIVENAIELAIGKSLDRQTHEDLVMEALREAIEVNQEA
jgi:hypothetical protein